MRCQKRKKSERRKWKEKEREKKKKKKKGGKVGTGRLGERGELGDEVGSLGEKEVVKYLYAYNHKEILAFLLWIDLFL